MHPYHGAAKAGHAKKLASYGGKTKGQSFSDTKTWDGEPGLDSGKVNQPQRIPTRKTGGRVDGEKSAKRLDKAPRGKHPDAAEDKALFRKMMTAEEKKLNLTRHERAKGGRVGKGKTVVNVVVSPQGGAQAQPQAVPVPRPVPVPVGGPPPGGPPMGAGAGPGAMPPGAMPPPGMMRKRGGRVDGGDYCHGPENASTFGKQAGGENGDGLAPGKFGGGGGLGRLAKVKSEGAASKKYASKNNY